MKILPPLPQATPVSVPTKPTKADAQKLHAAREFEAVFVRKMLSSLEHAGGLKSGESAESGNSIYGSMMVNALADAVTAAGGIGLADMIAKSLPTAKEHTGKAGEPTSKSEKIAPQPSSPSIGDRKQGLNH